MVKKKTLNKPDIPTLTANEKLQIENEELSNAISRIKYHFPQVLDFLTESQLEIVKRISK